jgi:ketosteroid isomerase-like protein
MKRAWIAFVCAVSTGGCAAAPDETAPDEAAPDEVAPATASESDALSGGEITKQVFERLLQASEAERSHAASRAGFAATVEAFAANDVVYSASGHALVRGKAAVAALLDGDDPGHTRRATFEPRRITVSADGTLGTTFGWNTFTTTAADGTATTSYGSYTTMWRRAGVRWTEIVHVQNLVKIAPTAAPAGFALLDPTAPVIRFAAPDATADEVAATDIAFAAASVSVGSATAVPAFATAAASEAISGGVFYGRDQVAAAHAADPTTSVAVLDWAPSDAAAAITGDLGYTDGEYVYRLAGSGTIFTQGTYLTVYQRQADGSWKWVLTNSNPMPATP